MALPGIHREPTQEKLDKIDQNIDNLEEKKIKLQYSQKDFESKIRFAVGAAAAVVAVQAFLVTDFLTKGFDLSMVNEFIIAAIVLIVLGVSLPAARSLLFRRKQVELDREIGILERHLGDLREQRDKYKSVLDADVSSLIRRK